VSAGGGESFLQYYHGESLTLDTAHAVFRKIAARKEQDVGGDQGLVITSRFLGMAHAIIKM
jgi:hypothetical protein